MDIGTWLLTIIAGLLFFLLVAVGTYLFLFLVTWIIVAVDDLGKIL